MATRGPLIGTIAAMGVQVLTASDLRALLRGYAQALEAHKAVINRLNVYPVPDGDTGTNMTLTVESVVAELAQTDQDAADDMGATCKAISHGSLMGARGNSGVILSQVLRGFCEVVREHDEIDGPLLAAALESASTAAYGAVMKPVEGTILTVVRASAEGARDAADSGAELIAVLDAARDAAELALARTPLLLPVLAEAGVVDAGGAGLVLLFEAALNVADGRPVSEPADEIDLVGVGTRPGPEIEAAHAEGGLADLRYEVMYFLEAPDESIPGFKDVWAGIGDSIVVVGGDGIWNCHIHTDDIGASIEAAVDVGTPRKIRVTDLFEQVEEERWVREAEMLPSEPAAASEPVPCAVVAVATGDGIRRIFHSLGVQVIVTGGQTMNPSTAQLLEAVERAPADDVVILPNNKNIIPVAEQVDGQSAKNVRVVPTRGIAEGFASLLAYDPQASGDENVARHGRRRGPCRRGRGHPGRTRLVVRSRAHCRGGLHRYRPRWDLRRRSHARGSVRDAVGEPRRDEPRDRHRHRGRRRNAGVHPSHRGVAPGQPPRCRGRDPPRRPTALSVPLRHRVTPLFRTCAQSGGPGPRSAYRNGLRPEE